MKKCERIAMVVICGVFIWYVLFLIKILFLSRVPIEELFDAQRAFTRSVNLDPLRTIRGYWGGGTTIFRGFALGNVVGNVVLFVPLGIYLPLLRKDKRLIPNWLIAIGASAVAECIQWMLGIGAADVDDIILNGLGALIGIIGYKLLSVILRDERKARAVVAVLSVLIGVPVLYYFMFMIILQL